MMVELDLQGQLWVKDNKKLTPNMQMLVVAEASTVYEGVVVPAID
jgi:hypothetical protein